MKKYRTGRILTRLILWVKLFQFFIVSVAGEEWDARQTGKKTSHKIVLVKIYLKYLLNFGIIGFAEKILWTII